MPGFEPHSTIASEAEDVEIAARNSKYGLNLFVIYFAVYAGFVILNAFRPDLMEKTPWAGINVAIIYGFGLIFGALILSLVYGWLCQAPATPDERRGDGA